MKTIATKLGLHPDASEETILAAIDARVEASKLQVENAGRIEVENVQLRSENSQLSKDRRSQAINAAFAQHKDRFPLAHNASGQLIQHPSETALRTLAETDLEQAVSIMATLATQSPTGAPASVVRDEPGTQPDAEGSEQSGHAPSPPATSPPTPVGTPPSSAIPPQTGAATPPEESAS